MRRLALLAAATAAAAACGKGGHPPTGNGHPGAAAAGDAAPAAPQPLRLVVLIVIDQLPSWSFDRALPVLTGGLARITRDGVFWPRAHYPYGITYTATGHAALATGAPPAVTRLLGNSWYRRDGGRDRSAVDDPDAPVLAIGGAPTEPLGGVSPVQLAVDGIADALRREHPDAHSVAIGLKDRGAVFALGKHPDLAIWYEPALAAMTTSRWYTDEPPAWLTGLAVDHPIRPRLDRDWRPGDPDLLARVTGNPDDAAGEGGANGLGRTFPHPLVGPEAAEAMVETPLGTEVTMETVMAAIAGEHLGEDDVADLLAVTFSGHDYAGHLWGQESWERLDLLIGIDRALGEFLDGLDRTVGRGRWAVVLAADHGAAHLVEQTRARGESAFRVRTSQVIGAADRAAAAALGKKGPWAVACTASTIYFAPGFAALPAADRDRALDAAVAAVAAVPGVGEAARSDRLAGGCERRHGAEAAACWSLVPDLSGEIYVQPAPGSVLAADWYTAGTSHGSDNPDDTDVPIAVLAPGLAPRRSTEMISPLRVAPTLARLLGVAPPPAAHEPPLP